MKKIIAILLCALMLILPGCGEIEEGRERLPHVYKATEIAVPENVRVNSIHPTEDGVLMLGMEILDWESGAWQNVMIRTNKRGGGVKIEPLAGLAANCYYEKIHPIGKDELLYIEYDGGADVYRVARSKKGKSEVLCGDLEAYFADSAAKSMIGKFFVQAMCVDGGGNIVIATESDVCVFDAGMKFLYAPDVAGTLDSMGVSADGRVWVGLYVRGRGMEYRYLDAAAKALGDAVPLPENMDMSGAEYYLGPGYDVYFDNGSAVYGYTAGSEPMELMNWANSDLIPTYVRALAVIDADTMVVSYMESGFVVYLMERVPEDKVPARFIVDLAVNSNTFDLMPQVVAFNRQSKDYRIRITDYSLMNTDNDPTRGDAALFEDMLTGKIPDLLRLTDFSNRVTYVTEGYLTDLTPFLDGDFDRSAVFENVLTAFNWRGGIYELVTDYNLATVIGKAENLPESWSIGEFISYAENLPDGTYLLDNISQTQMIHFFLNNTLPSFIDETAGRCAFDSDEFRRVLEFCKNIDTFNYAGSLSGDALADYNADMWRCFREDTVMIDTVGIHSFGDWQRLRFQFGLETIAAIGYPSMGGAILRPNTSWAIPKSANCPAGAWEFLMWQLRSGEQSGGFGLTRAGMEAVIENEKSRLFFYEYDGTGTSWGREDAERTAQFEGRTDGLLMELTDADAAAVLAIMERAMAQPYYMEAVRAMILEEAQMYFSGDKSLDETADVIQSRVQLYLSEMGA
ncbi:MAG: hypothetical protein E7632_03450 [Ruminococcaceae bacterium]|nr:hypothetical protein [Oscillospiraceae bacterium]